MKYPKRGIPTKYQGILFRSRLEATWAAFFDLCGWRWEYEPFDLQGYIPDFLLHGAVPAIVDVKPLVNLSEYHVRAKELDRVCGGHEVLIVGCGLYGSSDRIGLLTDLCGWDAGWEDGALMTCSHCGRHSYYHTVGSFQSRVCGHGDGDHYLGAFYEASDFWAQAKNAVQWRAPVLTS